VNQTQIAQILFVALFIWLTVLSFYLTKTVNHYKKLTKGAGNVDLDKVLEGIIKRSSQHDEAFGKVQQEIGGLLRGQQAHLQKFSLIRFNPFEEEGGDQSFVLTILNGKNDGIVISSLYSRSGVRVYAKQVEGGKPAKHQFTKEEKEAIEKSAHHA